MDAVNGSQIIAEQIIPEGEGGFWIREIGLFDADDALIAVANCAETYKPQLQEGSGRTQTVRMILIVNSADAVTLKIDPSVVLATRKYVDDKVIEVKSSLLTELSGKMDKAKNGADIQNVAAFLKNLGLGKALLCRWVFLFPGRQLIRQRGGSSATEQHLPLNSILNLRWFTPP